MATAGTPGSDERLGDLVRRALADVAAPSLSPERRRVILDTALAARRPAWKPVLRPAFGWGLAAAAALAVVVVGSLALRPERPSAGARSAPEATPASVEGLQVTSEDGNVVLRWPAAEGRAFRVIRTTDPRRVEGGEVIHGNTWTDAQTNGAQIVFYRVEPVEG
jgi:hypothetical protein